MPHSHYQEQSRRVDEVTREFLDLFANALKRNSPAAHLVEALLWAGMDTFPK
jgi:hypothetical protein